MATTGIEEKVLVQICVVVEDLDRAVTNYREIFGFDIPQAYDGTAPEASTRATYMGQPADVKARWVSFPMGSVTFELLQPLDDKSAWADFLKEHGPGIHHMTFNVPRTAPAAANFADHGYQVTHQGLFNDRSGMYTYVDTEKSLGITLEFLEFYNGTPPPAPTAPFPADKGIGTDVVCQIGLVVNDIDLAAERYRAVLDLPEPRWVEMPPGDQTDTVFMGEATTATARLAFFDFGQVQVELIEPDTIPSVWRNFLNKHGDMAHHIAFQVKDTNRVVEHFAQHGIGVAQQGLYGDRSGMYTYMDSEAALGIIVELLESFSHNV